MSRGPVVVALWLALWAGALAIMLIPFAHRPASAQEAAQQQAVIVLGLSHIDLCAGMDDPEPDCSHPCPACQALKAMVIPPAPDLWSGATHLQGLVWQDTSCPRPHGTLVRAPPARGPPISV